MTIEERYRRRYKPGDTPWDVGQPDFNLIEVVTQKPVLSCKVLDIGCGTGDNSIWLAQNGFQVTGTDTSDIALEMAKEKASKANAECDFRLVDFLKSKIEGAPFGFVFDRGCFHSFSSENDRRRFARNVAAHLEEAGLWLTIVGNADEHRQGPGPPQRTAGDIILAVEPYLELLSLTSSHFGSNRPNPPRAWRCLMQKRHVTRFGEGVSMTLSKREIKNALKQWNLAWDNHDLEGVMTLFHDEVLFENWTGGKAKGKDALRKAWTPWFANHRGFRFTEEETFIDEEEQKVLYRWQLEWPSSEKSFEGKPEKRRGVDVLHFQDGKIIKKLTYSKTTIEIEGERFSLHL